jgi:hypothetical protein
MKKGKLILNFVEFFIEIASFAYVTVFTASVLMLILDRLPNDLMFNIGAVFLTVAVGIFAYRMFRGIFRDIKHVLYWKQQEDEK